MAPSRREDETGLGTLSGFLARNRAAIGRTWQPTIWLIALGIGLITAYAVIGFRKAIAGFQWIGFGSVEDRLLSTAATLPWYHIMAVPMIGGLVVGLLLYLGKRYNLLPEGRSHGVADVIEARGLQGGYVAPGNGLMSALVASVSLGAGASAGREGPAVHLGASIASFVAQRLNYPPQVSRTLLACGAAAAVSASFNAPIAGVLFALEVILGHYALSVFAPIVIASASAAMITRYHLGEFPTFIVPDHDFGSYLQLPAFALLGIVSGITAIIFIKSVSLTTHFATKSFAAWRIPVWGQPMIGGIFIGLIGIYVPQVLGVGYEATDIALKNLFPVWILLLLIAAKIAATSVTLACRFGGGVFSPALFLGVMVGGAFGNIAGSVFPDLAATEGFYAILGMGAVSAAILGAPISTTLIAFELVREYEAAIALMVSVSIATVLTQSVLGKSFFHWQIEKRGHFLQEGPQNAILKTVRVHHFMSSDVSGKQFDESAPSFSRNQTLLEVFNVMDQHHLRIFPVVDEYEAVIGFFDREMTLKAYNQALIEANIEIHR